jgi:hypothetical protein
MAQLWLALGFALGPGELSRNLKIGGALWIVVFAITLIPPIRRRMGSWPDDRE